MMKSFGGMMVFKMDTLDWKEIYEAKEIINLWCSENEWKVNQHPRKITQKQFVEESLRLGKIKQTIYLLETKMRELNLPEENRHKRLKKTW